MNPSSIYLECAFVLGTVGFALIWPPLALLFGAAFLAVLAGIWYLGGETAPAPTQEGDE